MELLIDIFSDMGEEKDGGGGKEGKV